MKKLPIQVVKRKTEEEKSKKAVKKEVRLKNYGSYIYRNVNFTI